MKDSHVSSHALLTTLHDLVANYRFSVTEFQRPYSWKSDQAASFVDYLLPTPQNLIRERVDICGSLLLFQQDADAADDRPTQVIDGQHRIGTWLLALSAVQSLFERDEALRNILDRDETVRDVYDECCRLLNSDGATSFRVKPAAFRKPVSPVEEVRRLSELKQLHEGEERSLLEQRKANKKDVRLREEHEAARTRRNESTEDYKDSALCAAYEEVKKVLAKQLSMETQILRVLTSLANPRAQFHVLCFRVERGGNWPLLNNLDLVRIFQSLNGRNQPLTELDLLSSGQGALATEEARQALNRFYAVFIEKLFPRLEEKPGTFFKCYCLALAATGGKGVDLGKEAHTLWNDFEKLSLQDRTKSAEKLWDWCGALEALEDDGTRVLEQLQDWSTNCIEAGGPAMVIKETMPHVGDPKALRAALRRVSIVYNVIVFADTNLRVKKRNLVRDVGDSSMEEVARRYCFPEGSRLQLSELGPFVRESIIEAGSFYESKAPRKNAYRWLRYTQLMTSNFRHRSEIRALKDMELDHAFPKVLLKLFGDEDDGGSEILHAVGNLRLQHRADNRANGAKPLPSKSASEPFIGLLDGERSEMTALFSPTDAFRYKLDAASKGKLDSGNELTEDEIAVMRNAVRARTMKIAHDVGDWVAEMLAPQESSGEA
jgi:hypothetical protein